MLAASGGPAQDGDSEVGDALPKAVEDSDVDLERGANGRVVVIVDSELEPCAAESIPMSTVALVPTTLPRPSQPNAMNRGT